MPLEGTVFLALWNDFDPARDVEYERWHTFEHVPERVGVPGMIRGRRYRATDRAEDRYFTLYEIEDPAVLTSAPYLDLVERPTAWSRAMRPSFRNVARIPCETVSSAGIGSGGCVATVRIDCARALDAPQLARMRAICESGARALPATALHLGRSIAALGDYPVFKGAQAAADRHAAETLVLLIEATVRGDALAIAERFGRELAATDTRAEVGPARGFDLAFSIERADLALAPGARAAPRDDIRNSAA